MHDYYDSVVYMQVAALKCKGSTGVRWHPLFVRWCLNITRTSPKAYEMMRSSGIKLPTRRTLNDYTHWITAKSGKYISKFQA